MVDLILEANRQLYPALPIAALVMFLVHIKVMLSYPTSVPFQAVVHRRELVEAVRAWPLDRHETAVRWFDYAALSKREIAEVVGERSWSYRGQDMYAEGWPLYFTRDGSVTGVLEAEEAQRAELQARTAEPPDDDDEVRAPDVPIPGSLNRLLNLTVLFGSVTILPLVFLLLVPGVRESSTSVLVLGAVALLGAGPFARSVVRLRPAMREHRDAAHRDRALRLYDEGTPERDLVDDLRGAVADVHGVHRLDVTRFPSLDPTQVADVARSCGWKVLSREGDEVVYLGLR